MKRLAALALLALPSLLLAAPVPKEVKKEEKTEGTWQMESLLAYGRPINFGAGNQQHWTIDAEGQVISHQGPVPPENGRKAFQLVFEPKAKAVDYKYTNGNTTSYPGVYDLTGDTLKICCHMKGQGVRPTTVDAGPDVYLWTFKRVKAEEKK
jgi:uncharacterized protein (TIGR03067 family)